MKALLGYIKEKVKRIRDKRNQPVIYKAQACAYKTFMEGKHPDQKRAEQFIDGKRQFRRDYDEYPQPVDVAVKQKRVIETYNTLHGHMLFEAAELFSKDYGVWGPEAASKMNDSELKQGRNVEGDWRYIFEDVIPQMNFDFMQDREAADMRNYYVRCIDETGLLGYTFATLWRYEDTRIMWISQMVVRKDCRRSKIATNMLKALRKRFHYGPRGAERPKEWAVGMLSVHPAAIRACYRAFAPTPHKHCFFGGVEKEFGMYLKERARPLMLSCPINSVREAGSRLKGDAFLVDGNRKDHLSQIKVGEHFSCRTACCAQTDFYIDHTEKEEVMSSFKCWPCEERNLPEGSTLR